MCRLVAAAGARTGLEAPLTRMTQNDPYENDATTMTHVPERKMQSTLLRVLRAALCARLHMEWRCAGEGLQLSASLYRGANIPIEIPLMSARKDETAVWYYETFEIQKCETTIFFLQFTTHCKPFFSFSSSISLEAPGEGLQLSASHYRGANIPIVSASG
jgi:uncharacterized protein YneR